MFSLRHFCRCLITLINVSVLFEKNILIHGENTENTPEIFDTSWEDEDICPSFLSDNQCTYFKKLLEVIGSDNQKRILDHITSDKQEQIKGMEEIEKFEQDEKPIKNKHSVVNQIIITSNGKKSKMSSIEEIEKLEQNFIKENKWLPDFEITQKDVPNLTVVSSHNLKFSNSRLSLKKKDIPFIVIASKNIINICK